MADLDGLRKRVEQIDLRLKTAHRAREKESTALMDMWEQIRERLTDQNAEITRLRSRVADLEDTRDDLLGMVHGLLSAVEGGLERMSDETVPKINAMENSLLHENGTGLPQDVSAEKTVSRDRHTSASQIERDAEDTLDAPNFHDDLLSAIKRSIENVRIDVTEEVLA